MKTFEEVVNEITKEGYCVVLNERQLMGLFDSLSQELRWEGTYYGWQSHDVWKEVCKATHKYMQKSESY